LLKVVSNSSPLIHLAKIKKLIKRKNGEEECEGI